MHVVSRASSRRCKDGYKGMVEAIIIPWLEIEIVSLGFSFLYLSRRLIGELIVYQSLRRPSVCQHFQTSSPLKPLSQLNSNFIWRLLRIGEQKFVQMVLVTWPRLPPRPYMVITLQKSSPEPEGWWPWDLVCSIEGVRPTKFVQLMILGWPWPT